MKQKILIALLCLFLSLGLVGFAEAGHHHQPRPSDSLSAADWVMTWLGSLVSQAQDAWSALQGTEPHSETYRADTNVGEQPAPSSSSTTESGAEEDDDGLLESGPMAEPFG